MDLSKLKETNLFGRFFLKASEGGRFDGYYCSLEAMYPLLTSKQWVESVTGYYINVGGDFDAVRLSYFTSSPDQPKEVVDDFVAKHGLKNIKNPTLLAHTRNSEGYGGEELRFRRFLSTYGLIGLDIMKRDLFHSRCLLAIFRWQIFRERKDCRDHFMPTFQKLSSTFNSLDENDKEQLWEDLNHWPNPPQVDWAHFLVNMVLGCDWNWVFGLPYPQSPLSISEINEIVNETGFQIPEEWNSLRVYQSDEG